MTGKTYGRWTVLYRVSPGKWYCRCSCSKLTEKELFGSSLRCGSSKSCGCLMAELLSERSIGEKNYSWRGGVHKSFFKLRKKEALVRGWDWQLSENHFLGLIVKNCYYCGSEPKKMAKGGIANGIDRIDSSIGYLESNCVPCCGLCNRLKLVDTQENFLLRAERIRNKFADKTPENFSFSVKKPKKLSAWPSLFKSNKKIAQSAKRNLQWELSLEQFISICLNDCYYCSSKPVSQSNRLTRNGVDRKDNNLGYLLDNCNPACSHCNRGRGKMLVEDFIQQMCKIANFQETCNLLKVLNK